MEVAGSSASQAFAAYVGEHAEDALAMFHLKRLLARDSGAEVVLTGK